MIHRGLGWTVLTAIASSGSVVHAGPVEFRVVAVRVQVHDQSGKPVNGAQVFALSERWHIRFPIDAHDNPGVGTTDARGICDLRLPVGHYAFCAVPGWDYLISSPGQGFVLVHNSKDIQAAVEVSLSPDSRVQTFADPRQYPDLKSGRVMARSSHWGPAAPMLECAHAKDGVAIVATNAGTDVDLAFHGLYEASHATVHFLAKANVRAPAVWRVPVSSAVFHSVDLEIRAPDGGPGNGNIVFAGGDLARDEWSVFFNVRGSKRLLLTPAYVKIWQCELRHEDRVTVLIGQDWIGKGGERSVLRFGGALTTPEIIFHSRDGCHATQYCVLVRDAFGNPVSWSADTSAAWSLKHNGQTLALQAEGSGFPSGFFGRVFQPNERPSYSLRLDLGAYGPQPELRGIVDGEDVQYKPTIVRLPYADFRHPRQLAQESQVATRLLERGYRTYVDLLGSGPEHFVSHVEPCGVAGGTEPYVVGMFSVDTLLKLSSVGAPDFCEQVALHELGHAFASSFPPHRAPWYEGFNIIESWPTLLALEAQRKWHGDQVGDYVVGRQAAYLLRRLGDNEQIAALSPIGRQQFAEIYMRQKHGWEPMRRFFQLSYAGDGSGPDCLKAAELNNAEAVAALYSYVCGENFGWLYRMLAFDVTDERVAKGVEALQRRLGRVPQR